MTCNPDRAIRERTKLRVLEWCNETRHKIARELGIEVEPIDALRPAKKACGDMCVIALALSSGTDIYVVVDGISAEFATPEGAGTFVYCPDFITDFIFAFDNGEYPELDADVQVTP